LTAAGATMALPIITVADAKDRIEHHIKGLEAAMRDYYPGLNVRAASNHHTPEEVWESGFPANYQVTAFRPEPPEYRRVFKSAAAYERAKIMGHVDEADIVIRDMNAFEP
jgi:hypothetical protein